MSMNNLWKLPDCCRCCLKRFDLNAKSISSFSVKNFTLITIISAPLASLPLQVFFKIRWNSPSAINIYRIQMLMSLCSPREQHFAKIIQIPSVYANG